MTEDEAKTKWCPMARKVVAFDGHVGIEKAIGDSGVNCIGAACMMWRWDGWGSDQLPVKVDSDGSVVETMPPKHGHCGLAGK